MSGQLTAAASAEIWERFLSAKGTLGPTPGIREAWHRGRARYALWLLHVDDPRVGERMDSIAQRVKTWASPVPREQRHITLFVCGFPLSSAESEPHRVERAADFVSDDVDPVVFTEQVAALRAARLAPFELLVGGVNAFLTAPFLHIHDPGSAIARLRDALLEPLTRRGSSEVRFAPYVPHLTLAHFTGRAETHVLADTLAPFRELPALPLRVSSVQLVDFCTRTPHAPFRILEEVALGA